MLTTVHRRISDRVELIWYRGRVLWPMRMESSHVDQLLVNLCVAVLVRPHTEVLRLVLTDVIMPAMNGRDLVEAVRAICPGVAAVYVSGYTANVIAHRGVLDRDVCFLSKPFSISELAARVREELNGAG